MAEEEDINGNLAAARDILNNCINKSRDIDMAIKESAPRLANFNHRLTSLERAFKHVACKCSLYNISTHVDEALGPASAVLDIFHAIRQLQTSLQAPGPSSSDLRQYLIALQRIQDALRLLRDNINLVILWLEEAVEFFKGGDCDDVADAWYVVNFKKALKILEQLQGFEETFHLSEAFNRLEHEFRRLLIDNSFPPTSAPSLFSSVDDDQAMILIPSPSFPLSDIKKMQTIMERLTAGNRLNSCTSIYVEVRSSIVRASLRGLDLGYLQLSLSSGFDSVQNLEDYIDQWGKHLQFAVRYLFEIEYRLCLEVFQDAGLDVGMECFANVVVQSGFYDFIEFGNTITGGKKEAIKLLKLLDTFAALNKLRLDFNRLFSGKFCIDIQTRTRELIKRVINGACEIFWELSVQVESQRPSVPPLDGSVPRLVRFVTDYCNILLEDEYKPILLDVLEIHCCWNNLEFEEGLLSSQIQHIMKALELNLQTWGEVYEDSILSYFFRMNSYWYFSENIKGTKLGDLLGHNWLMAYEEDMEHNAAIYLRESWGKLPAFLSEEGLVLFPGGRAIDRDLAQKRLNEFNKAFEDLYTRQIYWVLSEKGLRKRTRQLIMQVIIPPYKNYIQKYMPLSLCEEEEDTIRKHVKYTTASLEDMINFLFQPKLGKYGSSKCTHVVSKFKNVVTNHFPSTPAAA